MCNDILFALVLLGHFISSQVAFFKQLTVASVSINNNFT